MRKLQPVLLVLVLGALMGFAAKALDNVPIIGHIGSELGIWVFTASLVGYYSRTAWAAALHVFLFFAAMLGAYYLYSAQLFGFFPKTVFLNWALFALASPFGGWLIWQARGRQWPAALCASLPIALLVVQGYPFVYTYNSVRGFDLVAALVLLILLPKELEQKVRTLFFTVGVGLMMYGQDLVPRLFGGL